MKIEVEISQGDVGKTVQEILQTLGPEDRRSMAAEIMKEWLKTDVHRDERYIRETAALEELRAEDKKNTYGRQRDEKELRDSWEFKRKMEGFQSSREKFVKGIIGEVIEFYKSEVRRVVEADPLIVAMRQEVAAVVKENFPKMVHDAMMVWFAGHMENVIQGVHNATAMIANMDSFKSQVADRIGQISNRLGF